MNYQKIYQAVGFFLRKTFDIREGEMHRALLMQVNIFLIITTLLIVKPTVNGLFLSKFGVESLPYAFLLVSVVAALVSTIYSKLLNKISLNRMMSSTLVGSVISLILFGILLHFNIFESITLYLFYIWVAIFALLTTSQFWVLANIVFNAREAKRLFGFVGAGAIVGGIFGGYLTSVLAQFASSETLPFIGAFLLSFTVPITTRIWSREVVLNQTPFQQKKKIKSISVHPFTQIRQSKHLTYIACIVGVSVIVAKLVDYQFGGLASSLITDPDELTAFFGFWFSTFNVISLLMQLFITRKVVGRYGVGSSLYFLPGSILFALILLMLMPELLMAAVFLKMADGGLKQSVNKAAMELLILPIPQEVKNQTKTFIDVFVDSLATGISGLALIFLVKGLDLSTNAINLLILFFLLIWMYFAYKVKGEYFNSFRRKIYLTKASKRKEIDIQNESVIGGINKVLKHGNEKQLLFMLDKINEYPDNRFFEPVQKLIQHSSSDVRAAAIRVLYFYKQHNLVAQIEPLVNDPTQKVKIAAFEYLLSHQSVNRDYLVKNYLEHSDYQIRYTSLVSLAKEIKTNQGLKTAFQFEELIQKRAEDIKQMDTGPQKSFCTIGLLKAIGYSSTTSLYPVIQSYMLSSNLEFARQAIISAGNTLHPQFLDNLIEFLAEPKLKIASRDALINYGTGTVDILLHAIKQTHISLQVIRAIPSVVKNIHTQKSVDFLFDLLDYPDFMVRQEALRGLNSLRNKHPHLVFSKKSIVHWILDEAKLYNNTLSVLYSQNNLHKKIHKSFEKNQENSKNTAVQARAALINLLEKRLDRNLERIFRLLGLKYSSADILSIYKGVNSNLPDLRVNAIEFLDNLLEPGLKKIIIPIIETSMLETISEEAIQNLNLEIPEEDECLRILLNSHDLKVKLAVLRLISNLNKPEFVPLLESFHENSSENIRPHVEKALKKLKTKK